LYKCNKAFNLFFFSFYFSPDGNKLKIPVDAQLAGVNASTVAELASK